jgi:hypothetical protein
MNVKYFAAIKNYSNLNEDPKLQNNIDMNELSYKDYIKKP